MAHSLTSVENLALCVNDILAFSTPTCGVQCMRIGNYSVRRHKIPLAVALVLVSLSAIQICVQRGKAGQFFTPSLFRYAIIYNDAPANGVGRDLHVLMDPSEFSEANLRFLFVLLSRRFQALPGFTVYVETSLQDIQTPEERDGPGYSEVPSNPKAFKHPSATIKHSTKKDTLYIYVPSGAADAKKIDLRVPPSN